eukprot:1679901-Rhodomonas_salina.1
MHNRVPGYPGTGARADRTCGTSVGAYLQYSLVSTGTSPTARTPLLSPLATTPPFVDLSAMQWMQLAGVPVQTCTFPMQGASGAVQQQESGQAGAQGSEPSADQMVFMMPTESMHMATGDGNPSVVPLSMVGHSVQVTSVLPMSAPQEAAEPAEPASTVSN